MQSLSKERSDPSLRLIFFPSTSRSFAFEDNTKVFELFKESSGCSTISNMFKCRESFTTFDAPLSNPHPATRAIFESPAIRDNSWQHVTPLIPPPTMTKFAWKDVEAMARVGASRRFKPIKQAKRFLAASFLAKGQLDSA
mmetsp:Transcript_35460/g.110923  ORF Transcript_35460/g.110923 Transcript_35460/m.110923 type:complete len:140 (-) Transcript_35460:84-503(-)